MAEKYGVSLASIVAEIETKRTELRHQVSSQPDPGKRQELEGAIQTLGSLQTVVKGLCPVSHAFPPRVVKTETESEARSKELVAV